MNKQSTTEGIQINLLQADIIYKALRYVAHHEGVPTEPGLEEVFVVLAEDNPFGTEAHDVVHVMEHLRDPILDSGIYDEYFQERKELVEDE